ncbi:PREDICTED: SPIRAL1 [Prunus dulcis]|uniref:PREDICTED: SPIRAL1 n=1 Tax=Prunus dulcis TaxID=3755 RepID=A0A5E4FY85_PRUDU|nr:protein SPIRAL1-like 2 [Prunus dulcis]VVA32521.1 PREDICTED: SPIRAL1 [Prunus dulcis]
MGRGRGVSCGGGQSSLGYLFGGGETANVNKTLSKRTQNPVRAAGEAPSQSETAPAPAPASASSPIDKQQIAAGLHGKPTNNYHRAEGQNCGNFITDRPSTKVHSAPGGGSSLGYLFGSGN